MNPQVVIKLTEIFDDFGWAINAGVDKEVVKDMFDKFITELFESLTIRKSVLKIVTIIPKSWPKPIIKLFAILLDNIAPEDADLHVYDDLEGVTVTFKPGQFLRLEKTINNRLIYN